MDFIAKHPRAHTGDLDPIKVPLVVYVDGERKVIGEAVVDGETIYGSVGEDVGEKLVNYIDRGLGEFSIGRFPFVLPPNELKHLSLFGTEPFPRDHLLGEG